MPDAAVTILYVAQPALWTRLLVIGVGSVVSLLIGSASLALLTSAGGPTALGLAAVAITLPASLVIITLVVLGQRLRFRVTTQGVEIRTLVRTHRLPWRDIAKIDVDHGWVHQGQTLVTLHDGRRIGAPITEARSAMRRGERTSDHGPGLTAPARPTREAIDALDRWRRGEFDTR